jgi:hypothetical protein
LVEDEEAADAGVVLFVVTSFLVADGLVLEGTPQFAPPHWIIDGMDDDASALDDSLPKKEDDENPDSLFTFGE